MTGFGFPTAEMGPAAAWRLHCLAHGLEIIPDGPNKGESMQIMIDIHALQRQLATIQPGDIAALAESVDRLSATGDRLIDAVRGADS